MSRSNLVMAEQEQAKGTILVVDDEPGMRLALREVLQRAGWRVRLAASGEEAIDLARQGEPFDLLMTDYRMGGMNGLECLRALRVLRPGLPSVLMTAYGTIEDAVQAMKEGAGDYLLKPFSYETVVDVVSRVQGAEAAGDGGEPGRAGAPTARRAGPSATRRIIAVGPALRASLDLARDVADADSTILLTGESGVGKEVIARYIHEQSGRRGPFVAINCAALPEGLLESELFGHEKGAFTGAILARKGRFEQANGGTLLLDEVSEMPLALQAKLLRVLQEKEIVPVGGTGTVRLDVRVIATTNRDLERAVADGQFRQDLFYRLNVIALPVPPLRERPEDILPLAEHFLRKYHREGRPEQRLADDFQRYLLGQPWPGNVRELENLIERACLLARGEEIRLEDLHLGLAAAPPADAEAERVVDMTRLGEDEAITLEEMERRLILRTLTRTGGNRTRTADMLGVSVRTIRNKLSQWGMSESCAS